MDSKPGPTAGMRERERRGYDRARLMTALSGGVSGALAVCAVLSLGAKTEQPDAALFFGMTALTVAVLGWQFALSRLAQAWRVPLLSGFLVGALSTAGVWKAWEATAHRAGSTHKGVQSPAPTKPKQGPSSRG